MTALPAGAKRGVAESAAGVDAGRVVIGRRAGRGRAALYQATLTGSRVTRLRSTAGLTPTTKAEITDVAVSPAAGGRPTFAFRTQDVNRTTEFTQEDLFTARGTHTPSTAARTVSSGTNFTGLRGASWESGTRLWYAVAAEEGANVLRRFSTLTKRSSSRPSDASVTDTAWRSSSEGVVATVQGDAQGRLHATGSLGPR